MGEEMERGRKEEVQMWGEKEIEIEVFPEEA